MAAKNQRRLLNVGSRAPEFHLERLDGGRTTLADLLASGPVLLVFYKITCPICQLTLPFLERLHKSGAARVFGVSQNDSGDTRDFARHFGLSFPMLLDLEEEDFFASNAYEISSVPTMYFVGQDGKITHTIEGWLKTEMERLGALRPDDNVPAWKAG
jgi:peroxiredoxin